MPTKRGRYYAIYPDWFGNFFYNRSSSFRLRLTGMNREIDIYIFTDHSSDLHARLSIDYSDLIFFRNIVIMPEEPIPSYTIKDVWAHNVEEEFRSIRKLTLKYPYVAMVCLRNEISFFDVCFVSLLGYRISRYCCSTIRRIQNNSRISISMFEIECGFFKNHSVRFNLYG